MRKLFALLICSATLWAHPMGNFSVSHFAKLQPGSAGLQLEYVLDLAEIPTLEILQNWKLERSAPEAEIQARASKQAREWLNHLAITVNDLSVTPRLDSVKPTISDGAGNLPILRIEMLAHADASGGNLTYEDSNYPQRAGWKEIVVVAGKGGSLVQTSQTDADLSHALMRYPADPLVAPPQDLRAAITWKSIPLAVEHRLAVPTAEVPAISRIPQPKSAPAAVNPVTMTAQGAPAGSVTRGDFLSRLLHQKELSLSMILIALAAAFGLGAVHALTPGHGKAIVAAYLVGSRGTLKHAAFLGAMVTFTHTISVFALGLATLFLFRFIVPERITAILGVLSGLSIVVIGAFMLYKRVAGNGHGHSHSHSHSHGHAHVHSHPHTQEPGHSHTHEHAHSHSADETHTHSHEHLPAVHAHTHTHGTEGHTHAHAPVGQSHSHGPEGHMHSHGPDGHSHSHVPDGHSHSHVPDGHSHSHVPDGHSHSHVPEELSWAGLVALGASGGLVPCESALVLLLGAIALGRAGLGLLLLVSFSLGLALVLMLIGVVVLYAKRLLPESTRTGGSAFFRWAGIVSPAVVMVVGLLMTAASLGWIESKWMVG